MLLNRIPAVSNITTGIQGWFSRAGTSVNNAIGRITKSEDELVVERDYYQDLAAQLAVDQMKIEQLSNDVEEMQALLEYKTSSPYKAVAARIIARSEKGQQTFIIDKGENDGVRSQLAVSVENGHMIGWISEVRKNTSTVTLLQSETSKVPATIIGTEETVGIVEGQEGFLLHMGFIPQRVDIAESDVVVTSGLDGIFPQGIVVGAIESVQKNETSAFQEAFIRPFYDADNFTNVLILDPLQQE